MKNYRCHVLVDCLIFPAALFLLFMMGCASEADKLTETAKGLYRQSITYRNAGETQKAEKKLNEVLDKYREIREKFPNHFGIAWDLYEIWEESYAYPSYEAASLVLRELSTNFPKSAWTGVVMNKLWLVAYDYNRAQNYEEARRTYQELVKNFPESNLTMSAWYDLGKVNYQLKDYENARKVFREYLGRHSRKKYSVNAFVFRDARRLIAQSYLDQEDKDYHQAYLHFDKLITEEFNDDKLKAEAMYKAASCLKELAINDEALGRYAEFMVQFPDSKYVPEAYFDLGELYANNKKNYEIARFNYNRALRSSKDQNFKAKSQYAIAATHYKQKDLEKALTAFKVLLREYPETNQVSSARNLIAHIYKRDKEWNKAIAEYESIIKAYKDRKNPPTLKISGEGLMPIRVNLVAFSYLEIGSAYYELAASHKKLGETEQAIVDFSKALGWYRKTIDNFPQEDLTPRALFRSLLALCELGQKDHLATIATIYINALQKDNPVLSAEAQLKFADVLREELKQYNEAATEYAKLENYLPKPYPRLNLTKLRGKYYEGLCYEKGARPDKSVEAYQEVIRLFEAIFRPLIDIPNIDVPHGTKEEFDHCIQTARYYVGNSYFATNHFQKASDELKEFLKKADPASERGKTARDKIEKAHRKLDTKIELPKSPSNSLDKLDSSVKSENGRELTTQDIAEIAASSTVFIEMEGILEYESGKRIEDSIRSGSGFYVGHGQIVTNYHVIKAEPLYFPWNIKDDGKDEVVSIHPLEKGSARLVGTDKEYAIVGYTAVDPDRDLAILKVRTFGVKPLSLGNSEEVNQGDRVYPIGNPLGLVNVVSDGQISSIQWVESIKDLFSDNPSKVVVLTDVQQDDTNHKLFMMTAPISGGNSGGPVLNGEGKVIGISVGSRTSGENLNFAVPVNYLKALLKRTGPSKPLSDLEIVY